MPDMPQENQVSPFRLTSPEAAFQTLLYTLQIKTLDTHEAQLKKCSDLNKYPK